MNERKTIYLDDAIDAVSEGLKHTFVEHRDVAEKMLNNVPSAEPQWVLCSERLPESDGRYLVTTAVGFCKVTTMRFWTGQYWWELESTQAVLDGNVLAWAELPEPC
jgi:hypothetical protein